MAPSGICHRNKVTYMIISWGLHYYTFVSHFNNIIFEFPDDLMEEEMSWGLHYYTFVSHFNNIIFEFPDDLMEEEMVAHAIQEELNYLFSDSLTDADLLRAVEVIESARASADQVAQTSAVPDDIHTTVGVQSIGNVGSVSVSESPQIGKFCTFTICISASPVDIGRKPVLPCESTIPTRR